MSPNLIFKGFNVWQYCKYSQKVLHLLFTCSTMKTISNRAQRLQISFSKAKMHFYTETYGSNDKNFGMISMQRSSLEDCFKHLCLQIYPIVKFQVFLSTSNIAFMSATGSIRRESEAAGEHGQGDQSCCWVHCCGF